MKNPSKLNKPPKSKVIEYHVSVVKQLSAAHVEHVGVVEKKSGRS